MKGRWRALCAVFFGIVGAQAHAALSISGTRVVYPAARKQVGVRLSNEAKYPVLVQTWIDTGDPQAKPETLSVPFMLMPPVFRIEAGKAQTIRLAYTKQPLPQDRESVYWLNVVDIPPKPQDSGGAQGQLQIAYRTRIKLFFRPEGLTGDPSAAPAQVKWRMLKTGHGYALRGENPTPFAVSYAALAVRAPGASLQAEPGMIKPFETATFALPTAHGSDMAQPLKVDYTAVNDYGALVPGSAGAP